ncbi:MAG: 3-dehydroquinate synthase [Desulfobacteraceae bacterium 4572_88]|nr:MAG: 3-dehydroquinate synthase [Desulfobacteraceae bacterium 4572_88]
MKTLEIQGGTGHSSILVGERFENLAQHVPSESAIIITDSNVSRHYRDAFPPWEVIEIGTGETIKTLETVHDIYARLVDIEADRSAFIVGIGGGIVCDIAGFVASTYMRGVRFGFVSSTLLSQVDASVGGKNGVNFQGYKNMVGIFNQPEFVICDLELLKTLPEKEIRCGFGEIVKHALIGDAEMFHYLESDYAKAIALDTEAIEKLVWNSVVIKSSVVNQDEREKGERRKLNFGHTFGHAIEKTSSALLHGEAISAGMVAAAELSEKKGLLRAEETGRIRALLENLRLPTRIEGDRKKIADALRKDKKKEKDRINFVLLHSIGKAIVEEISIKELEKLTNDLCK